MAALQTESYRRWEREARQASCRDLEGLFPPVEEWASFLDAPPRPGSADEFDIPRPLPLDEYLESTPQPAAEPAPAEAPEGAPPSGGPPQELPESKLPDNLRAEIEDFLKRDGPGEASKEEIDSYLKGGIDPNVESKS